MGFGVQIMETSFGQMILFLLRSQLTIVLAFEFWNTSSGI